MHIYLLALKILYFNCRIRVTYLIQKFNVSNSVIYFSCNAKNLIEIT